MCKSVELCRGEATEKKNTWRMWDERRKNSRTNKKKQEEQDELVGRSSASRSKSCYTWMQNENNSCSFFSSSNKFQNDLHSSPKAVTLTEEDHSCAGLVRGWEDILVRLWMRSLIIKKKDSVCSVRSQGIETGPSDGHCGEMHFGSTCDRSF